MTSNQSMLLWKQRNCRQHEVNFIFYLIFVLWNRSNVSECSWYMSWCLALSCVWLYCRQFGSFVFFIGENLCRGKTETTEYREHSPNQSFCTQNCSIDIQKAAYELCREVVNIRNIIFVVWKIGGAVRGRNRSESALIQFYLKYFVSHISCANCLQFLSTFVRNIWWLHSPLLATTTTFGEQRATTIEFTYT